jgi:hypothetical protein
MCSRNAVESNVNIYIYVYVFGKVHTVVCAVVVERIYMIMYGIIGTCT